MFILSPVIWKNRKEGIYEQEKKQEESGSMNIAELEDREWEISRQLIVLAKRVEECEELKKDLAGLEEDSYWRNRQIKEINDGLFENYPNDVNLQNILAEKEEIFEKKVGFERIFWEDCHDFIRKQIEKTEDLKEEYERELSLIRQKREEEDL